MSVTSVDYTTLSDEDLWQRGHYNDPAERKARETPEEREARQVREAQETPEARKAREAREAHEAREAREAREALICRYVPLAKKLAARAAFKFHWSSQEDLFQEGCVATIRAVESRSFDHRTGPFKGYVYRVIINQIRNCSEVRRQMSRHSKEQYGEFKSVHDSLMVRLARKPTVDEIAHELGIEVAKCQKLLRDLTSARDIGFAEDLDEQKDVRSAELAGQSRDRLGQKLETIAIEDALRSLPPRESKILRLFYWQGWKIAEIARGLGLSETNVKQILRRSRIRLRELLEEPAGDETDEDR